MQIDTLSFSENSLSSTAVLKVSSLFSQFLPCYDFSFIFLIQNHRFYLTKEVKDLYTENYDTVLKTQINGKISDAC